MPRAKAGDFTVVPIGPGVSLYALSIRKFKTSLFKVFLETPLADPREATKIALATQILKRGCRRLPDQRALARYLESLYGASFVTSVSKYGERQVVSLRIEVLAEKFARKGESVTRRALTLLRDVLFEPVATDGAFPKAEFAQEKENLRRQLRARVNDKAAYASERLVEEMCRGEPYAIHEHGRLEDLDSVGPKEAFEAYERLARTAPMKVFAVGDFTPSAAARLVGGVFEKALARSAADRRERFPAIVRRRPARPRTITERMDVTQGKLVMGFRTDVGLGDRRYFALVLANAILGGGPSGKLFRNVREKAQLAYYAHSSLERVKGILSVHCGVAFENFGKAVRIVKRQIDDMKAGRFTASDLRDARLALERGVRSAQDSPGMKVNACEESLVGGRVYGSREILARVGRVRPRDVAEAARSLALDTTYFLKGLGTAASGRVAAATGERI